MSWWGWLVIVVLCAVVAGLVWFIAKLCGCIGRPFGGDA